MTKILISACLLGQKVRYDGEGKFVPHAKLQEWVQNNRIVSVCPECAGGLPVPRLPSEIQSGSTAKRVFQGNACVVTKDGVDVTEPFLKGAFATLELAQRHGIKVAILKERSPSCGSTFVYDGTFQGQAILGMGVTTALLRENGIRVFSENEIDEALSCAET